MKWKVRIIGFVALIVGLTATTVFAGVFSTSGITVIAPPVSVARNMTESNDTIFLFNEQQDVVLTTDLAVDITSPGTYGVPGGGVIPAGTCVNSYFIHYDLIDASFYRTGSVTFDEEVLGLITSTETLDASDWLGAPNTFYAKASEGEGGRALELDLAGAADVVTLSANLRTVEATLIVSPDWQDQIRVITQGDCAPTPPPTDCNITTSGMTVIAPPASVARNMTESNATIFAFCEQRDVPLETDLAVDITAPGNYGAPPGGAIPAGTCVNSYFIHYDLVDASFYRSGSAIFEEEVLGLITSNETLDASDWLGAPGTFYPKASAGEAGRRLELQGIIQLDTVSLSADRSTVAANMIVSPDWQDQIRVITLGVCEPGGPGEPPGPEVIGVQIDVKPNSDPSCFNSNGKGVIPVAVLGTADFDVKLIDVATLELDGAPVAGKNNSDNSTGPNADFTYRGSSKLMAAYEDYNHDGYIDLVVKFVDMDNYDPGDEWATLTGNLLDGTPITGTGDICITQ